MKKPLCAAAAAACLALLAPGTAAADPHGGGCQLNGTATISPGLTSTAQNFSYSFTGDLTNCQSSSGGPASGTVFAGTGGLPVPSGNGSCGSSTTGGIAVVQWADGTTTVVDYTTTGALAAVSLEGTVIASLTTPTTTYTTTRYLGDSAQGGLLFEPPDPTACAGAGVTSAGIEGIIGLGNSS